MSNSFLDEVASRFGMVPNFFCSAPAAPGVSEALWTSTKSAYLDSPLPPLFKERLCVSLSRFCEVRYCVVRHVGFLVGEGHPAGDPAASPQTIDQALALLRKPVPDSAALEQAFARLEACSKPAAIPAPGTPFESDLFAALTALFLEPHRSTRARRALRRSVGDAQFEVLLAFLAFVRMAHHWTETHPELAYEPDVLGLMSRNKELAALLLNSGEAEATKAGAATRNAVTNLRATVYDQQAAIAQLRETQERLRESEAWLAAQGEAFQVALSGAPLKAALDVLIRAAVDQIGAGLRCAFYVADASRTELHHVTGMSESYAAAVHGFKIGPDALACGLAASTGDPVITPDVTAESRWIPWRWLAEEHGYRACWSFPIATSAGQIVGTFAMYFPAPREPSARNLHLVAALTQAAAIIISRHQETEERARFEARLEESEERFRQFGDASQDVLWIRNAETFQWEYLTPAFEMIYGLDRASALRGDNMANWVDLIVPEDRESAKDNLRRVRDGEKVSFEYRIRRPVDRQVRWLRNTDFPIRDEAGRIVRIGGIGHDITVLKEAEERLRDSEQRLRLALNVARMGTWDWNIPANDVQWSDEHFRLEGYAVGEVKPSYEAWADRIHPDDRAWVEQTLVKARDEHLAYVAEFRSLHPDGTILWLSAVGTFFYDAEDRPIRMIGAMQDVTERREWQEQQKVLVAELQHRTRNLIAVVRSIAQQTIAQTGPTEAFREQFNDRLSALSRVQGLLSRADAEPITIGTLLRMELDALGAESFKDRIVLDGPEVRLRNSVVQTLALALHELATNALKYGALTTEDGELRVTWTVRQPDGDGRHLYVEWLENGVELGRELKSPASTGYGRELIERALPYALNAVTRFELGDAGVRCTIDLPLTHQNGARSRP